MKQYAERDIMELDKLGGYYCRHVSAMTSEQLHSKSDIAAELDHRDMMVAELLEALRQLRDHVQDCYSSDNGSYYWNDEDHPMSLARAAIAKALGE